eukprot:jgi/Galph1/6115/GphlegSOOS_G4702.1
MKCFRSLYCVCNVVLFSSRRYTHTLHKLERKISRPEYSAILSARLNEGFTNVETLLIEGRLQPAQGNGLFMVSGPSGVGLDTVVDEAIERFLQGADSWELDDNNSIPRYVIDLDCKQSSNPIKTVVQSLLQQVFSSQALSTESPLKVWNALNQRLQMRGFLESKYVALSTGSSEQLPAVYDEKDLFLRQIQRETKSLMRSHPFHAAVQSTLYSIANPHFSSAKQSASVEDSVTWQQFCFIADLLHSIQNVARVAVILRNIDSLLDPSHSDAYSRQFFHDMLFLRRSKEGKGVPVIVTTHQSFHYVGLHPAVAPSEFLQIFPLRSTQTRAFLKLYDFTCEEKAFENIYRQLGGYCGDLADFVQRCSRSASPCFDSIICEMKQLRQEQMLQRLVTIAEELKVPLVDVLAFLDAAKRIRYRVFVNGYFGAEVWNYDSVKVIVQSGLYHRYFDPPMIIPSKLDEQVIPNLCRILRKKLSSCTLWWYRMKRLTGMYSLGPLKRPIERMDHLVDRTNLRELRNYDIPSFRFK